MRYPVPVMVAAAMAALGGCGGSPQEERAEQVEAAAENEAEAIEESAEDAPEPVRRDAERNAEVTLEAAKIRADAIRDSEGKLEE